MAQNEAELIYDRTRRACQTETVALREQDGCTWKLVEHLEAATRPLWQPIQDGITGGSCLTPKP